MILQLTRLTGPTFFSIVYDCIVSSVAGSMPKKRTHLPQLLSAYDTPGADFKALLREAGALLRRGLNEREILLEIERV